MVILGIDTSSTDLSVCLSADGVVLSSVDRYVKNAHAEHIAQAVAAVLSLGGAEAGDVTHIALSAGPGSFTGLRIGYSFIKGFCMAVERDVFTLSSLFVLAHAAGCGGHQSRRIFTALDSRQGRVHWGSFTYNGDKKDIRRLTEDRLSPPEELLRELSPDDLLVIDTMGYQRSSVFNGFSGAAQITDARKSSLRRGLSCASVVFDNIVSGGNDNNDNGEFRRMSASQIVPNYLQASAAEEKRAL